MGYHLVINFFQNRQEGQFQTSINNNNYNDEDLVIIKLPVNLPYYNNSSTYERVSGSVEVNGTEYKYVKRRIYNDSVELACLPNLEKQKFQSVKNEFFKLNNDWQNNHQGKKSAVIKNTAPDFCNKLVTYAFQQQVQQTKRTLHNFVPSLPLTIKTIQEQPPDFLA